MRNLKAFYLNKAVPHLSDFFLSFLDRNSICPYFGTNEGVGNPDREPGKGADGRVTQHEDGSAGGRFAPAPAAAPPQAECEGEL